MRACSIDAALTVHYFWMKSATSPFLFKLNFYRFFRNALLRPVGSHGLKRFEGRVIAATNRSIEELRREGNFRDDFFYRLCSDVITVPTLRQRIEESPSELEQMVNLLVTRMTGEESSKLDGHDSGNAQTRPDPGIPVAWKCPGVGASYPSHLLTQHYNGDVAVTRPTLEEEFVGRIMCWNTESQ